MSGRAASEAILAAARRSPREWDLDAVTEWQHLALVGAPQAARHALALADALAGLLKDVESYIDGNIAERGLGVAREALAAFDTADTQENT